MKQRPDSATLRPASARIPGAARAAAGAATLALAACASMLPPAIPSQLQPAAGEALAMIVPAKGVQIYECRARRTGDVRVGLRRAGSGALRHARQDDRHARRRSALAVERRQQGRGQAEAARRRARPGRHSVAASRRRGRPDRRAHSARSRASSASTPRAASPRRRLQPGNGRPVGARRLPRGLLLLHRPVTPGGPRHPL